MLPSGLSIASPGCSRRGISLSTAWGRLVGVALAQSGRFPVRSASLLSRPDLAPPEPRRATEGNGRSGATRSHAQRALAREHGEDGEHRTFPAVSTVAHSAPVGGSGRCRSIEKRYVTKSAADKSAQESRASWYPAGVSPAASAPNTILCASSCRHSFNRRCSVRSCPSGKTPGCLLAAAQTTRAMSAMVRPRTIHAPARSPSRTDRDAAGRAGAFSFGLLVGRTSPSCHAVRSPERNCSSVEGLGAAASPVTGRSAISTSSC